MLELRAEPPLPDEEDAKLGAITEQLRTLAADPFGLTLTGGGLLADAAFVARAAGARELTLELFPASPEHDLFANMAGFHLTRVLLQLRRALPLWPPEKPLAALELRPFRPGTEDEAAWLEVNNRAFSWHPEQSNWTLDDLHARMAEPWFDPDGFLLHHRDGRLAAFCWTKIHEEEAPPAGEIFVIGIDPDFQGQGIAEPLTRAGFDWLAAKGLTQGLLYAESDNQPAVHLYGRLGFRVAVTHRWYAAPLTA